MREAPCIDAGQRKMQEAHTNRQRELVAEAMERDKTAPAPSEGRTEGMSDGY